MSLSDRERLPVEAPISGLSWFSSATLEALSAFPSPARGVRGRLCNIFSHKMQVPFHIGEMRRHESEQIEGHSTGVLKGETLYDLTPLRPQYTVISHSYLRMMNNLKENALMYSLLTEHSKYGFLRISAPQIAVFFSVLLMMWKKVE